MSEAELRRRMCGRKRKYRDYVGAQLAKLKHEQRHADSVRPYRCRFCGRWHIGH